LTFARLEATSQLAKKLPPSACRMRVGALALGMVAVPLERFKKLHSHSVGAVLLGCGFVSAQLQAAAGMRLRQSLPKTQKSSLRTATPFLETL